MPLVRLVAEGVGPFEKLDLDFSDGKGNPHPGPHILAGVNGSGKSTALKAIAWALDWASCGFPGENWGHFLTGHSRSRAALFLKPSHHPARCYACTNEAWPESRIELEQWVATSAPAGSKPLRVIRHEQGLLSPAIPRPAGTVWTWVEFGGAVSPVAPSRFNYAAYGSARSLAYLENTDLTKNLPDPFRNCLSFEETVQSEFVHSWLLGLYSKRALARELQKPAKPYAETLERFNRALSLVCGEGVVLMPETEPTFHLRVRLFDRPTNFAQLPDGVRSTMAWLSDFMMRQDRILWDQRLGATRPGLLLLDEVDAHLHPSWQRRLLPAMKEALPDVQIIVASHSPFVISSCEGARVHVLEVDEQGRARAQAPHGAPFGWSVTAALQDNFGVGSRWDLRTEQDLQRWDALKRREAAGRLARREKAELRQLIRQLSERSEELRFLVGMPRQLSTAVMDFGGGGKAGSRRRKSAR